MAETSNKAALARKVFAEIFELFGWKRLKGKDLNWTCVMAEKHNLSETGREKANPTHPSDLVCLYRDPYATEDVYVNIDLKAFGSGSFTKAKISGALASLMNTTACMQVSAEFQGAYHQPHGDTPRSIGMLFAWNHDNKFDGTKFRSLVETVDAKSLQIDDGLRAYVLGPDDIGYLLDVATDIQRMRSTHQCTHAFFYPNLIQRHARDAESPCASIETLTAPWMIAKLPTKHLYVVYCRGGGEDLESFTYMLDMLERLQFKDHEGIAVRLVGAKAAALSQWERAIGMYVAKYRGSKEVDDRLRKIQVEQVSRHTAKLFEWDASMED